MSQKLTGKVAVVTGGASGIGRGIATRLRDAGATVVISDIDAALLATVADELGVTGIPADVSKANDVQRLADETVAQFGHVDIVCNNAGVGSMGRIANLSLDDWKWMLDINLWGVIHGIHSFLPLLQANGGGHIINTASLAAVDPHSNMGAYVASKMAVMGLTESLAHECAEDGGQIKASVLLPGPVTSNIKESLRHRPGGENAGFFDIDASKDGFLSTLRWMDPLEVGDLVVNAVGTDQLYIVTHPELGQAVRERFAAIGAEFTNK